MLDNNDYFDDIPFPNEDDYGADRESQSTAVARRGETKPIAETEMQSPNHGRPHTYRPQIKTIAGEIDRAVDEAIAVLADPDLGVFSRGDELVRVVTHADRSDTLSVRKAAENVKRPDGAVVISGIGESSLVEVLTRHANFTRYDGRSKDWKEIDCPADVARMIIARKGSGWSMPPLRAVIGAPTLRADGSVIDRNGYDEASGLFLSGRELWHAVPDNPSQRDALDAIDVLLEPISALPFVDNSDRAAAIALLVTAVIRPSLRTSPMFAVTAPAAGTGKSLTIDIASILATGRTAAVITPTSDEAELEKRIGAACIHGDQIISIDNVSAVLRSDQLCQLLTQDVTTVRVLGASKNVKIPNTALICATGNNLSIYGDLNRRVIRIRLDAKVERPDEREFPFDAIDLAKSRRAEMVAASLTVVKAYMAAGTPSRAPSMGSFDDWSDLVRSALIWLGMGDCRGNIDELRAADPELEMLAEVIAILPPNFDFSVKDIASIASTDGVAHDALADFFERGIFSAKRFGRYLKRHAGRIVNGRHIEQARTSGKAGSLWRVISDDIE